MSSNDEVKPDVVIVEGKVEEDITRVYQPGRLVPVTLSFFTDLDQAAIASLKGKLIEQMEKDLIYGN